VQASAQTEPPFARESPRPEGRTDSRPVIPVSRRWWFFVSLAALIALYVGFGIPSLDKPGLYMDAVDPDYLVARMIHPDAPTEFWMLPGNLVAGRWPILAGPYSGSFVAYLLVPFALVLGETLTAIRVAHLCLGLAILIAAFVFLRIATRSQGIAFAVTAVLAVDPAFVLLFRTQAYICIFPAVLAVLGFIAMLRSRSARGYAIAGVLFGLAAYGYFIFFFLMPGLVLFCAADASGGNRRKLLLALLAGVVAGASPYVMGYGLVIGTLGFQGAVDYVHSMVFLLKVNSSQSYLQRLLSVTNWSWLMLTGAWNAITFWGTATVHRSQEIKAALLLAVPVAALPFARGSRDDARMFRLVGFSTVSYLVVATVFGQRLGGHDLTPLLPLLYILTGLGASLIATSPTVRRAARGIAVAAAVTTVLLFAGNATLTHAMTTQLNERSGSGLFSSILSDYPKLAEANNDRTPHIFWKWGSLFQFIYLTDGKIPAYSGGGLNTAMCRFGAAKIVLTGAETVHHPDLDFAKLGARVRATELLRDRYSGFPYEIVTVTPKAHACAPTAATVSAGSGEAPAALQLPDGIATADAAPATGIYRSLPGQCCFLADRATFSVRVPAGTRGLRFALYAPNFARIAPQRVTIVLGGTSVKRTPVLTKGTLTPIDVNLRSPSTAESVVSVAIIPSTSFVPKNLGISPDTRTVSVVLTNVAPIGDGNVPPGSQLPDGIVATAGAVSGIYPGAAGECCFVAAATHFHVRVSPAARTLRFVIYVPDFPAGGQQQLTFSVGGTIVRRSGILRGGSMTAIEAPIPPAERGRSALAVTIVPRFSFVPKELGISPDTRRVSVVLMRVSSF
jgi:hypothetical protein